ncbi:hypothetical protein R0131_06270 [Clostridium sp. AL.422]|uniref:hypothetical protein n=1 Tax=Clostridium TaxID=1485 RepID=UPI00293DEFAA|nr:MULTISPECIES: hypothetical protein [unclassified Clostridium]MDV4150436.1 hypothetical protein [Clostridium sp. AL.422]
MKKYISMFLISFSLSFCIFTQSAYAVNIFDEGVYQVSDFNLSQENKYIIQNISDTESIYLQVFDENQIILQAIRLPPKSDKFNLTSLKPDYRIVIVGKGNIYIS